MIDCQWQPVSEAVNISGAEKINKNIKLNFSECAQMLR